MTKLAPCPVCLRPLKHKPGPGRPKTYHPDCYRVQNAFELFITRLDGLAETMPREARRGWRSRLMVLANTLHDRPTDEILTSQRRKGDDPQDA